MHQQALRSPTSRRHDISSIWRYHRRLRGPHSRCYSIDKPRMFQASRELMAAIETRLYIVELRQLGRVVVSTPINILFMQYPPRSCSGVCTRAATPSILPRQEAIMSMQYRSCSCRWTDASLFDNTYITLLP